MKILLLLLASAAWAANDSIYFKSNGEQAVGDSAVLPSDAYPIISPSNSTIYGVTAATGNFTGTGNAVYSVTTSSGISVGKGVVASFFVGDGSALTNIPAGGSGITSLTGDVTATGPGAAAATIVRASPSAIDLSTVTLALGAKLSSVTINASMLGAASASSNLGVDSASVTIKSGNLIRNSEIDSSSVTKQGNSFNGASQLVQMTAATKLPAVDGSLLTGVVAANVAAANVTAGTLIAGVTVPSGNLSGVVASSVLPSTVTYTTTINTFSSSNTFTADAQINGRLTASTITVTGSIQLSSGSIVFNSSSTTNIRDLQGGIVFATSFDGAQQSSGCVVAVYASTQTAEATLLFTSTTTVLNMAAVRPGVLLETCAKNATCRVGIQGIYQVIGAANASYATNKPSFSATRCQISSAATGATTFGTVLRINNFTNGMNWLMLP